LIQNTEKESSDKEEKDHGKNHFGPMTKEELIFQFRYNHLWKFTYEEWFYHLAGIQIRDKEGLSYVPIPQDVTFIPLTEDEIDLLKKLTLKNTMFTSSTKTEAEAQQYNKLSQKITTHLPSSLSSSGFFIRLSTRSPKDVPKSILPCQNAADVLFLLSRSERCFLDLELHKKILTKLKYLQIVVLPWIEIPLALEFRCFVKGHKLNAISQYDAYTHYFDILQDVDFLREIKSQIHNFHQQLAPFMPYPSYVMDVYIEQRTSSLRVHLIELNPFYADMSSGSALFEWKRDYDLLYSGTGSGTGSDPSSILRVRKKLEKTEDFSLVQFLEV